MTSRPPRTHATHCQSWRNRPNHGVQTGGGSAHSTPAIGLFDNRPISAIRDGDIDGNDATEGDASWTSSIDTPMHPEYRCAHGIVATAVGTVLQAAIGGAAMPNLTTTSPTAKGVTRSWVSTDDFMQEVANARIYDDMHYRNSTEVGTAMGRQIGEMAVAKYLQPPK